MNLNIIFADVENYFFQCQNFLIVMFDDLWVKMNRVELLDWFVNDTLELMLQIERSQEHKLD